MVCSWSVMFLRSCSYCDIISLYSLLKLLHHQWIIHLYGVSIMAVHLWRAQITKNLRYCPAERLFLLLFKWLDSCYSFIIGRYDHSNMTQIIAMPCKVHFKKIVHMEWIILHPSLPAPPPSHTGFSELLYCALYIWCVISNTTVLYLEETICNCK